MLYTEQANTICMSAKFSAFCILQKTYTRTRTYYRTKVNKRKRDMNKKRGKTGTGKGEGKRKGNKKGNSIIKKIINTNKHNFSDNKTLISPIIKHSYEFI